MNGAAHSGWLSWASGEPDFLGRGPNSNERKRFSSTPGSALKAIPAVELARLIGTEPLRDLPATLGVPA
jgi:hypothetical protein